MFHVPEASYAAQILLELLRESVILFAVMPRTPGTLRFLRRGISMLLSSRVHSFVLLPAPLTLLSGALLTFSALVYFFAWNWHVLPAAAKFTLAGGGTAACMALALAAERRGQQGSVSLAMFASALFTGLFWVVFGQIFPSDAPFREFCLAWTASTVPLFLLRRTAPLWNLLVVLLSMSACFPPLLEFRQDGYTSHLLASLLVAAACCVATLLRRPRDLNAYLALPLVLMLAEATLLCTLCLFSPPLYQPTLPEIVSGPLVLTAALAAGLVTRHALTLSCTALCGVALLNVVLLRLFDSLSAAKHAVLFTLADGACAVLLAFALPRLSSWKHHPRLHRALAHVPALFGGLLCALSLLTMTALIFTRKGSDTALLIAGLVYMPCGVLLWRRRGKSTFLSVLGSVLVSGGSLCFHIGLLDYDSGIILSAIWTTAVLLYMLLDYPPMRFFTVFWALVSSIFFLPRLIDADLTLPAFFFCLLPLVAASAGRFPRSSLRPAALASLLALLLISPSCPPVLPLHIAFFSVSEKIAITAVALNLAVLVWRHRPTRRLRPTEHAAALITLTALWYLNPLENLVAFSMFLAAFPVRRDAAKNVASPDVTLLLFGAMVLIVNSLIFYYLPLFSLSLKMMYMGIPGLCLLAAGLLFMRKSHAFFHRAAAPNMPLRRQAVPFVLCALVLAVLFSVSTVDRLRLLCEGKTVLLPLTAQERAVFMLGDSMTLLYEADRNLSSLVSGPGCLPLKIDDAGRARPRPEEFLEGSDCGAISGPALTVEKTASGKLRLRLPRRWYFEEGLGLIYEDAVYAALLFDRKNRVLLKGLADKNGRLIHPPHTTHTDEKSASPSPTGE